MIGEKGYPIQGRMQQYFLHRGVVSFAQKYNFKGVWHSVLGKSLSKRFVRAKMR
jgi:hypothetical protein